MRRLILLGVLIGVLAGCGGGGVDRSSDAYSDGESCGRIYALRYGDNAREPPPLKETVSLCEYNRNSYRTPGGSGNEASYVAGVKDSYRRAVKGG